MEAELIKQVATQVPGLVVLVILVVWFTKAFMRYLSQQTRQQQDFFREMHKEHLEARENSRMALNDNTVALVQMRDALGHFKCVNFKEKE